MSHMASGNGVWTRLALGAATAALAIVLAGCPASTNKQVDADKGEGVTTVGKIDIQDFNRAANVLTKKMLNSPNFQEELQRIKTKTPTMKPLMFISRIKNDTGLKVNMRDFLVAPMEETLQESGKVEFFSDDLAIGGTVENARLPDLNLYGTVSALRTTDGNTRQGAYVFHLRLATPERGGVTVWQGQEQIVKTGSRSGIGL